MKEKFIGYLTAGLTALLSLLGFVFRRFHLSLGFTPEGLPTGERFYPVLLVTLLALAFFCYLTLSTAKRDSYEENFSKDFVATALYVLAAVPLLAAGGMEFLSPQGASPLMSRLTAGAGIVTGFCFVAQGLTQFKGQRPAATIWLFPIGYYILRAIFSFKSFSADPILEDYCFRLFALLFTLLSAYGVGGFGVGQGKRRISLFFCLCGIFFSAVTLADGGFRHILLSLSSICWLSANCRQLLKKATS